MEGSPGGDRLWSWGGVHFTWALTTRPVGVCHSCSVSDPVLRVSVEAISPLLLLQRSCSPASVKASGFFPHVLDFLLDFLERVVRIGPVVQAAAEVLAFGWQESPCPPHFLGFLFTFFCFSPSPRSPFLSLPSLFPSFPSLPLFLLPFSLYKESLRRDR